MYALHMSVKVKVGSSWLHCASYFTFSPWSIKCSKTRPGSKVFEKGLLCSVCLILLGVQDRGLANIFLTEKFTKFTFTLIKSKLSDPPCNIFKLWKAKDKQNDPFSKITFSPASIFVMTNKLEEWTEILLITRWSCYSFAPGFSVQSLYCMSLEKKCNPQWKPFSLQPLTNPKRKQKR